MQLVEFVAAPPAPLAQRPLPNTFWSSPLPDNAALHPNSAAIVAEIVRQKGLNTPVVNGGQRPNPVWSSKIAIVPADQPVIPGVCNHDSTMSLIAATGIPVPADIYVPPNPPDSDRAIIIYQPTAPNGGFLWSMQAFQWLTPGVKWACNSLDRMSNANGRTTGHFVSYTGGPGGSTPGALYSTYEANAWGIQGSGLPYAPGIVTRDDLLRGYADHAVLMEIYEAASGLHDWPALYRTDGGATSGPATTLHEGMWVRQPPGTFIDPSWPLVDRVYMQAARDFGIIVTDRTLSCLAVRIATDANDLCDDLHLVNFTWNTLQALATGSDALWHPTS